MVDQDYQGELRVILHNTSPHHLTCQAGQCVAQLICERIYLPNIQEVKGPGQPAARGDKGFGSTDADLTPGQKIWVVYPNKPNQAREIISKGPGATYWVMIANAASPLCLDIAKL